MTRSFDNVVVYRKKPDDVLLLQPTLEALSKRRTVALHTRPALANMLVSVIRNTFFSLHGILIKHRCKSRNSPRR